MPRELLTDFELMVLLATLRVEEQAYAVPNAREIVVLLISLTMPAAWWLPAIGLASPPSQCVRPYMM